MESRDPESNRMHTRVATAPLGRLGLATWYPRPESDRVAVLRREGSRSAARDMEPLSDSNGYSKAADSVHAIKRRRPIQGRGIVGEEGFEPPKPRYLIYSQGALGRLHTRQWGEQRGSNSYYRDHSPALCR